MMRQDEFLDSKSIVGYRTEEDLEGSLFTKNYVLRWFISWGEVLQMNLDILQLGFVH